METKAEKLLASGLAEAQADLAFIRAYTGDDATLKLMIDSAIELASLYLRAAKQE